MSRLGLGLAVVAAAGLACVVTPLGAVQAHDGPPPNARPGECFGRVILPPVYGDAAQRVLEQPAWTETVRGRPIVDKVVRKVLVRPAQTVRVRTRPVYRNEVSWVERPGRLRTVREPDRYRIVRDKVLVEPGHAEWRPSSAPLAYGESAGQTVLQPTGEVMCRVWVPARYAYSSRKVLVERGRAYQVRGPASRKKVVRRVLVRDGGWTERTVAAVYRNEIVRREVREGRSQVISHPAVYSSVHRQVLVRAESPGWARVVCGGAIAPAWMAALQQRLIAQGFDPGPPDGVGRPQTYAALRLYQRAHKLAQGQITVETAQALGLL
ncbi:MAG TPA: peptidoglycan-binding domain-containing protein [Caulobacteraceae bacterium]|nr:peptidoglycan-binding domain-containing protein [Caulobacteraceae bacterium]